MKNIIISILVVVTFINCKSRDKSNKNIFELDIINKIVDNEKNEVEMVSKQTNIDISIDSIIVRIEKNRNEVVEIRDINDSSANMSNNEIEMISEQTKIDIDTDSVIVVDIMNYSDKTLTTGLGSEIEYFNSNKWEQCKFSIGFLTESVALLINPHSVLSLRVYLNPEYHKYFKGRYRIKKQIRINNKEKYFYKYFEII